MLDISRTFGLKMSFENSGTRDAHIADVLVGLFSSTDLVSFGVHVDVGLALFIHLFVLQLQDT